MIRTRAISTTEVVTAVIGPRLIDTASETVGCSSSPIEYTIENPTDTMQVEEWITGKNNNYPGLAHQTMTKQHCSLV
jgi:hypothetical protein